MIVRLRITPRATTTDLDHYCYQKIKSGLPTFLFSPHFILFFIIDFFIIISLVYIFNFIYTTFIPKIRV